MSEGGNAVDAAVSMGFVASVAEPTETSIGGSGFMLLQDETHETWSVEFAPRAPRRARPDIYELVEDCDEQRLLGIAATRGDTNATGFLAPCVPGVVAGLCLAHDRFGSLPLARVMEPSIRLAHTGFEIDAYFTLQALKNVDALRAHPDTRSTFLVDGLPPVAPFAAQVAGIDGPRVRQPQLADTLSAIGTQGPDCFYSGEIALAIAEDLDRNGGLLSLDDLQTYRATIVRPLRRPYRDHWALAPRSPNGGWTVVQTLRILDQFEPARLRGHSVSGLHLITEALRLAFADRYRFAADPDFAPVPLEGMLSDAYARELARLIHPDRVSPVLRETPANPWRALAHRALNDPWAHEPSRRGHVHGETQMAETAQDVGHGTTHFSVIDGDGRAVSCTMTAGNSFGSKVIARGTGVLLDSGMAWFNPKPGAANSIAPGKRPLVNMAPLLLIKNGTTRLALGAAGGRRIISANLQVISNAIDRGISLQSAVSAPRLDASDRVLRISERFPENVTIGLQHLGYDVVAVREEHEPFSYEFARPVVAGIEPHGARSGAIHPFAKGFVAGG